MRDEGPSRIHPGASSIIDKVRTSSLDASLLYEAVIELANEGFLTARCVNAAAGIVLTELGLPAYFFRHISKEALKRLLHAIATHIQEQDGQLVLRGELAEVELGVDRGVQVRIATEGTHDRMEAILNDVMSGYRVEYYFGAKNRYYTFIIRPETCKEMDELKEGESPFAFARETVALATPEETRRRYEDFLKTAMSSITPLLAASASSDTGETRVMFKDDFYRSGLPLVRKVFGDLGITLNRAYWETYRVPTGRIESICSIYLSALPGDPNMQEGLQKLRTLLALPQSELDAIYLRGDVTFEEYAFAVTACDFAHSFVYNDTPSESEIMAGLKRQELRDALAKRVFFSNRSEFTRQVLREAIMDHPEFIRDLYRIFDRKFNPAHAKRPSQAAIDRALKAYRHKAAIAFMDDTTSLDIFLFMARIVTHVYKTNFYKRDKRSHAFRLDAGVLNPIVFTEKVHGVFFVSGFYAMGTHMRAADVARGGLRLIRVTPENYENELDNMPLLNYALGPVAQRLKHKDIAESGSKGVIVPAVEYAHDGLNAVLDYTEGVMDLMQPSESVVDYLGQPEMIFFGPDEGTAGFMDAVACRAKDRGYKYWRTITTGKSTGIPHDTYGLTLDRKVFGLLDAGAKGTELQIEGAPVLCAADTGKILAKIGHNVDSSGMTTMGVMASFRTVLEHLGLKEEETNLVMTGGPDGDLGANQIQSFKGRICLIIDGGSVLFDPNGLDKAELMKIALARHTAPRLNSLAYPESKLGKGGFKIPRAAGKLTLPDGTVVEDAAYFHKTFLFSSENRKFIQQARIEAFVPCGGFKDTVNAVNVRDFLKLFTDLRVIVEGANVFFDDTARAVIAAESDILQIKDSSANKGGVTSSSVAEVLTAFLLGETYEKRLVRDAAKKATLVREVFGLIAGNAVAETRMLLALHEKTGTPLYRLSVATSEQLFAMQEFLTERIAAVKRLPKVVEAVYKAYIPASLIRGIGMAKVKRVFAAPDLRAYGEALLTKKLAAMALYAHAAEWDDFTARLQKDFSSTLKEIAGVK